MKSLKVLFALLVATQVTSSAAFAASPRRFDISFTCNRYFLTNDGSTYKPVDAAKTCIGMAYFIDGAHGNAPRRFNLQCQIPKGGTSCTGVKTFYGVDDTNFPFSYEEGFATADMDSYAVTNKCTYTKGAPEVIEGGLSYSSDKTTYYFNIIHELICAF